jgi:hypothetical protein
MRCILTGDDGRVDVCTCYCTSVAKVQHAKEADKMQRRRMEEMLVRIYECSILGRTVQNWTATRHSSIVVRGADPFDQRLNSTKLL